MALYATRQNYSRVLTKVSRRVDKRLFVYIERERRKFRAKQLELPGKLLPRFTSKFQDDA